MATINQNYYSRPGETTDEYFRRNKIGKYAPKIKDVYTPGVKPNKDYQTGVDFYGGIANKKVDERGIRSDILSRFQKEIDSYNQIYGEKLAEAHQQGLGRLGSARATQARGGLLGSDFAGAQNDKVDTANAAIESSINAEKAAKISSILGLANSQADSVIAEKRAAQEQGVEKYLEFLGKKTETTKSNLSALSKDMLAKGVTPDEIPDIKKLAQQYGVSEAEIRSSYENEKTAKTKADEDAKFEKEGEILKRNLTVAQTKNIDDQMQLAKSKFEEDKKQFGLEYALKARAQTLDEIKAGVGKETAGNDIAIQSAKSTIDQLDGLINSKGLPGVVGPNKFARFDPLAGNIFTGVQGDFIAGIDQITSQLTLDKLVQAKQAGATFGALSDGEREVLAGAATKLNNYQIKDDQGKVVGFKATEKQVKAELNKIKELAQRDLKRRTDKLISPDEKKILDDNFDDPANYFD